MDAFSHSDSPTPLDTDPEFGPPSTPEISVQRVLAKVGGLDPVAVERREHRSIRGVIEYDQEIPEAQKFSDPLVEEFNNTLTFPEKSLTTEEALALRGETGVHKIELKPGAQPKYHPPVRTSGLSDEVFKELIGRFEARGFI